MPTASDYMVDWRTHSSGREMGGCLTHACEGGAARAVCGVETGGDGGNETVAQAGGVGCRRCQRILESRGVLPLAAT